MTGTPEKTGLPLLIGLVRTMRDCCQRQEGEMCQKLGLNPSQFACLVAMPEQAGKFKVNEVAEVMGLSPSRASRIIESLVQEGLLARRSADDDRRTQLVELTPKGRKKWREAHKMLAECERKLLSRLTPERRQELAAVLKTLISAW